MNKVILTGRFTKKPELANTAGGVPVTRFTLAVDRPGKDKGADFIRVTAFDKEASNICKYMDKGRQAAIVGRLQTGSYNKDGQTIYTQDVICERCEFIGGRQEEPRSTDKSYHTYGDYSEPPADYRRFEEPLF